SVWPLSVATIPAGVLVSPAVRGQRAGATVNAASVNRASRQRSKWGGGSDIVVGPPRAGTKAGAAGAALAAAARTQRRRVVSQSASRLSTGAAGGQWYRLRERRFGEGEFDSGRPNQDFPPTVNRQTSSPGRARHRDGSVPVPWRCLQRLKQEGHSSSP